LHSESLHFALHTAKRKGLIMADKKQRLRDIIAEKSLLSGNFTLA
jgi:hypothetical protein